MAITATDTARWSNLIKKLQWPETNWGFEVSDVATTVAPVLGTVLEWDGAKWIAATATATKVGIFIERPVNVNPIAGATAKAQVLVRGSAIVSNNALVFAGSVDAAGKLAIIAKLEAVQILVNTTV